MLVFIGAGGAGSSIVDNFYKVHIVKKLVKKFSQDHKFIGLAFDTSSDVFSLSNIPKENRVLIGKSLAKSRGTGADIELGRRVIKEEMPLVMNALSKLLREAPETVVVFAGLGGGTGSSSCAEICREIKKAYKTNVIGVFVLPSPGEGALYSKNAGESAREIFSVFDGVILFDNGVLVERGYDIVEARKSINESMYNFFNVINEGIFRRFLGEVSAVGHIKIREKASVKDIIEKMLREEVFYRVDLTASKKVLLVIKGNLSMCYAHEFARGWMKNKFGIELEYELFDSNQAPEAVMIINGIKESEIESKLLQQRQEKEEKEKQPASGIEDLLKDIQSII